MEPDSIVKLQQFVEWITIEYDKWGRTSGAVHKRGLRPSQADFAKFLNVSPTSLSNWINEQRFPSMAEVRKVASKLGIEAYLKLGYPPEMPNDIVLIEAVRVMGTLPQAKKRELLELAKDMRLEIETRERNLKQQRINNQGA